MIERQEKIIEDHPLLFCEISYFECGEGWSDIIEELADKLESLIVTYIENIENPEERELFPSAAQVKEKYGTLRFYMRTETEEMSDLIEEAERKSRITCENCGKEGKLRDKMGWYSTSCDRCSEKLG